MTRYDRRSQALAAALSALAGFVDAVGYLALGGFFVSFMSGNSTRAAVGFAGNRAEGIAAAMLIGCFLLGVIAGSLAGAAAGTRQRPVVIALVALLLGLAAALHALGRPAFHVMPLAAAAMGAENAVFEENGETRIGLTYMTGTLVRIGKRISAALRGTAPALAFVPYLLLWAGLVGGAVLGALTYARFGIDALWAATGWAAVLTIVARMRPADAR